MLTREEYYAILAMVRAKAHPDVTKNLVQQHKDNPFLLAEAYAARADHKAVQGLFFELVTHPAEQSKIFSKAELKSQLVEAKSQLAEAKSQVSPPISQEDFQRAHHLAADLRVQVLSDMYKMSKQSKTPLDEMRLRVMRGYAMTNQHEQVAHYFNCISKEARNLEEVIVATTMIVEGYAFAGNYDKAAYYRRSCPSFIDINLIIKAVFVRGDLNSKQTAKQVLLNIKDMSFRHELVRAINKLDRRYIPLSFDLDAVYHSIVRKECQTTFQPVDDKKQEYANVLLPDVKLSAFEVKKYHKPETWRWLSLFMFCPRDVQIRSLIFYYYLPTNLAQTASHIYTADYRIFSEIQRRNELAQKRQDAIQVFKGKLLDEKKVQEVITAAENARTIEALEKVFKENLDSKDPNITQAMQQAIRHFSKK